MTPPHSAAATSSLVRKLQGLFIDGTLLFNCRSPDRTIRLRQAVGTSLTKFHCLVAGLPIVSSA
jgi:hypothetical protein